MTITKHRTKKLISESLLSLLYNRRDFEAMTISEICDKAMIHRTTFYSHFEDKFDLFQYTFRSFSMERRKFHILERIFQPFLLSEKLQQTEPLRLANELYLKSPTMKKYIEQLMIEAIRNDIQELEKRNEYNHIFHVPQKLLIHQICSTLVTIDTFWSNDFKHYSAKEIDNLYTQMIHPLIPIKLKN